MPHGSDTTPGNDRVGGRRLKLAGVRAEGTVPLPGTSPSPQLPEAPWVVLLPVAVALLGGGAFALRRRRPKAVGIQPWAGSAVG